jgi:hypothetical protein
MDKASHLAFFAWLISFVLLAHPVRSQDRPTIAELDLMTDKELFDKASIECQLMEIASSMADTHKAMTDVYAARQDSVNLRRKLEDWEKEERKRKAHEMTVDNIRRILLRRKTKDKDAKVLANTDSAASGCKILNAAPLFSSGGSPTPRAEP